jgi:hypothetical protein
MNKIIKNTFDKINLKSEYDICIVITTYNRHIMLDLLLDDINREKNNYSILIIILNDGGKEYKIKSQFDNIDIAYIHYQNNHSKYYYYMIINDSFKYCKYINSKYFIYLPDDIRLVDNFFIESIKKYKSIKNGLLNLLLDKTRIYIKNWTNIFAIDLGNVYLSQWCDLCFISDKIFFEKLEYKINKIDQDRWKKNKLLSSGVGQQISMRLFDKCYNMYHVKETLVIHGDHESKMNRLERIINKLIT